MEQCTMLLPAACGPIWRMEEIAGVLVNAGGGYAMKIPLEVLLCLSFMAMLGLAAYLWHVPSARVHASRHSVAALAGFLLLDGLMLMLLPRLGLSFGGVGFPLAMLAVCRWGLTLLLAFPLRCRRSPSPQTIRGMLRVMWGMQAAVLLCAFDGLYIEPFRLTVTHVSVDGPAFLPTRPLRIVHLTDLHVERTTRRERDILAQVAALEPDLIVLTGDYLNLSYLHDPQTWAATREFMAQLHAPYGIYAVTDSSLDPPQAMRVIFDGLPITVLYDETACVPLDGADLCIIGIQSYRYTEGRDRDVLLSLLAQTPPEVYKLLLYHTPDLIEVAAGGGIDLYLTGHTHGGQIRLPFYGAVVTFSAYGKKYEMGRYTVHHTTLYVSRGLGMEGSIAPRARFLCPPEIVVVDIG